MPAINPVTLPDIAFSKNQLDLVIESDDYLTAPAVNAINFLQFAAAIAADTSFGIDWLNGAGTMTAKDAPDDSGLQFPTGDGSDDYVTSLLPWFGGNFFINSDFVLTTDFTGDHPRIIFTAKLAGPAYNFTNANGGASGVITAGVTDAPKTDFAHHVQLWGKSQIGGADFEVFTANIPLDSPVTGKTVMDISPELDAFLDLAFDMPELVDSYAVCGNTIFQYYFIYGQYYGDPASIRKLKASDVYFIAKGGLSKQPSLLRNMVTELTFAGHPELTRFLRQGSINKLVTVDQPEWLTWINFSSDEKTIDLEVTIYNDDATSFVFLAVAAVTVAGYQKTQFQAGYTQLAIAAKQVDKIPQYYTCRVKSGAAYLSEAPAFVVDNQYREWLRFFIYENSYGAYQTLVTVGKGLNEFDRIVDVDQMAVSMKEAAINGDFLEVNILIQEKGTVNIGYDRADPRTTGLLRDFMRSSKKFLYENGTLIPIGLNTTNLKDAADGVNVYASSFEYYPLYQEDVYTETWPLVDDSIPELLSDAGQPVPPVIIPPVADGDGNITVQWDDIHLSIVGGNQTYTAMALLGKTGYAVHSTQLGTDSGFLRTEDIAYNPGGGSLAILIPGFTIAEGEQLIIFPNVINPDL